MLFECVFCAQAHDETKYGQKSTLGIVKVMRTNVKVIDNVSTESIPLDGSSLRIVYVTPAKERRFCNALRIFCLFVCLLATLRKNPTDLHEYFTTDISVQLDKEEPVKFWKSSASESGYRIFFRDSSTLRDRALSTIWLGESDRMFMKISSHICILGQESPR